MNSSYSLTGKAAGLYLGLDPHSLITTAQEKVIVTFAGFEGDRHAGLTHKSDGRTPHYPRGTEIHNDRQVSIVSVEELDAAARAIEVPEIRAEWLGANLLIEGIPNLTHLPSRTRLFFSGGVTLVVESKNLPCQHTGKIVQDHYNLPGLQERFIKEFMHLRGIVATVELPGIIRVGETSELRSLLNFCTLPIDQNSTEQVQFTLI